VIEIFLVRTPTFVWVYPWWGAIPVFITVYIPFFLAAFYAYDWNREKQIRFIGGMITLDVIMMIFFAGVLGWI